MAERPWALVATVVTLAAVPVAGCSPAVNCTQVGVPYGVSLDTARPFARTLQQLRLKVCTADECWQKQLALPPDPRTIPGGGPPDPGWQASAKIGHLPPGRLTVSGDYTTRDGDTVRFGPTTVRAKQFYPNGRACGDGDGGAYARVRLDHGELSAARPR